MAMQQLKHISSKSKYVQKFSILVLEVACMDKEDKFHYFIDGLQL